MHRLFSLLRASAFPLLALAGVALLLWGAAGWREFYRDLYLEEEAALRALAEESVGVRYRRAGDLTDRTIVPVYSSEPPAIPQGSPFVGRLEIVRVEIDSTAIALPPPTLTNATRDRVLQLPGLRGYAETGSKHNWQTSSDLALVPLDGPPPELPEATLRPEALDEPLPRGEAFSDDERIATAEKIAEAWSRPGPTSSRLVRVERSLTPSQGGFASSRVIAESLHLVDGERRLDFSTQLAPNRWKDDRPDGNVTLSMDGEIYDALLTSDEKRLFARYDQDSDAGRAAPRIAEMPRANADPVSSPDPDSGLPRGTLGDQGAAIVTIERLDDGRLYVESASEGSSPWTFAAVIVPDAGFAIERYELNSSVDGADFETVALRRRGAFRTEAREGETLVVESLSDVVQEGSLRPTVPLPATRQRIATIFSPKISGAAFDPASYGAGAWPSFRELPVVRPYRIAWVVGGGAVALGLVGLLFRRSVPRRRYDASKETRSADAVRSPTEAARTPRRFALRFSLLSLAAAGLIVIGVSGWIKRHLDDAEQQQSLLAELTELDARFEFERGAPAFPWGYVATDTWPVGAPLTSVRLEAMPSPGTLKRLLSISPDLRYETSSRGQHSFVTKGEEAQEEASECLGAPLPEYRPSPPSTVDESSQPAAVPRGERLSPEESDATLAKVIAAWSEAKEDVPETYLLRLESLVDDHRSSVTLRDGERIWSIDIADGNQHIETADDRHRRRYCRLVSEVDEIEWRLIERLPTSEPWKAYRPETNPSVPRFLAENGPRLETTSPPTLPLAPFVSMPNIRIEPPLDQALIDGTATLAGPIERLPDDSLRIELRQASTFSADLWAADLPIGRAILVVRPDLDYAVEACDLIEVEPGPDSDPNLRNERLREVRCRHVVQRIGSHVALTEGRIFWDDLRRDEANRFRDEHVRYAVDFEPKIDERLFDRPAIASPDPPERAGASPLPWYVVTFALGVATLLYAGARRIVEAFRPRRDEPATEPIESPSPEGWAP